MTSTYRKPGRYLFMYEEFMHEELVWRHDEIPWNGTIVVVACDSEPLRWAYLPEDAIWLDVENALHRGYRSHETGRCQVTVMKDEQIIDHWQFTILPGDQTASNWLAHQPWKRVRARERATGIYQHDSS